jgi:hypothetical protein
MRAKTVGAALVLAALVALGWLLLRPGGLGGVGGGAGLEVDAGDAVPGAVDPRGAGLAAGAGATGGLDGARGGAALGAHAGRGALVGTVRRKGAPIAARVEVRSTGAAGAARGRASRTGRLFALPIATESPIATASADATGRYAVEGLGVGDYLVMAIAADGARGASSTNVQIEGARVHVDLDVTGGTETLAGRVVHADGAAWRGLVVVDPLVQRGRFSYVPSGTPIAVDSDGRFRAQGLERGTYVVNLVDPGAFRLVSNAVPVPFPGGEYVLTIPATEPVDGRVVADADGSPVANAEIVSGGDVGHGMPLWVRTTSDAQGRFRVAAPAREGRLTVHADGFVSWSKGRALAGPLEVRLVRGGRVVGRLTADRDGTPVGGVVVAASPSGSSPGGAFATRATSDSDGRYAIEDVAPGEVSVRAAGAGWTTKGAADAGAGGFDPFIVTVESGESTTVDLVLVRGARLTGVVLRPDGTAVAGAVVGAVRQDTGPWSPAGEPPRVATAADGVFAFDSLFDGVAYDIVASAPDAPEARAGPATATTTSPPPHVVVRLVAPRALTVTVVDVDTREPIGGASVQVSFESDAGSSPWPDGFSAITDSDGSARVLLAPKARVRLQAAHEEYQRARDELLGEDEERATIVLRRALAIAGRVLTADGRPAARVVVTAARAGRGWVEALSDESGRFRLVGFSAGTVELRARAPRELEGHEGRATATAGSAEVEIVLARATGPARGLTVRVLAPDGSPVPRASVSVKHGGASWGTEAEDGSAFLDLRNVRETSERFVEVSGARNVAGAPLPYGPARVGPIRLDEREVEVRLPSERAVSGVVRDPDGKPVHGMAVVAVKESERIDEWQLSDRGQAPRARTDAEGRFRIGRLGDGDVLLHAMPPPEYPAPEPVRASGGQEGIEIRLKRGVVAAVTVLGEDGSPVAGASISLSKRVEVGDDSIEWRSERAAFVTGADGVARLRGLEASATYSMRIDGRSDDWLAVQRPEWTARDETIRLARAHAVAGIVRDKGGRPIAGARVYRVTSQRDGDEETTDERGRFRFTQVPTGEVLVRATVDESRDLGKEVDGATVVEARTRTGAVDVVLTLDPGLEVVVRLAEPSRHESVHIARIRADGTTLSSLGQDGGVVRVRGLRPDDRLALWRAPDQERRSAYMADVRAGTEVTLRRSAGLSITGRLALPTGASGAAIQANLREAHVGVQGRVLPDGRYEIHGLPPGTRWDLSAYAVAGTDFHAAAQDVEAGATRDLELKAP